MTKEELGNMILNNKNSFYRIAKTILTEDVDCADAISAAIVNAFSHIDALQKDKYAKTWFVRILINECYSILRQAVRVVNCDPGDMLQYTEESAEDYSDLYQAMQRLPEGVGIVITLYYMEGYHIREIADMLGISQSAVKNRLLRGRKSLKQQLDEQEGA